ncbi:MAG: YbgC/FadM family acyl-CoA thioesterase [Sulfuricurvum sp.]
MKLRVYYEDTDAGGIVYHSNYLNFCERARSEAFFSRSLMPFSESGHFVAKRLQAEYIASAKLGDLLDVKNSITEFRSASFTLLQEIYKGETKLFEMSITLVYTSLDAKVQRIPLDLKSLIEEIFS